MKDIQFAARYVPVLLVAVVAMVRLPERMSLFARRPGEPGWEDERLRWLVLLALSCLLVTWLDRDPAARRGRLRQRPECG